MSFPSDVLLPVDAKYLGVVDTKQRFNSEYDIIWSFECSISSCPQAGFVTYLTSSVPISVAPGHYLGYRDGGAEGGGKVSLPISFTPEYLLAEDGSRLLTEDGYYILLNDNPYDYMDIVSVAFDTTGLYALSTDNRDGVGLDGIIENSLIIRDQYNSLILNAPISAMSSDLEIVDSNLSAIPEYKIYRFKYTNRNKISIEYKRTIDPDSLTSINSGFTPLTSVDLGNTQAMLTPHTFPGFSFSSPVSSSSAAPGTLKLKNFHVQGFVGDTETEITTFARLTTYSPDTFNTITV